MRQVLILFLCCLLSPQPVIGFHASQTQKSKESNNKIAGDEDQQGPSNSDADSESCTAASDTKSLGDEIESIRGRFNNDGYVSLQDFFATGVDGEPSLVSLLGEEWNEFSSRYWDRIFQVLHEKGHISQPNHIMNQEYITGKLRQPGYKEIVHRYPGRYELSLPYANENFDSEGSKELYHDMPSLQPIIDKLEPVILSILKQHPNYKEEDDKKYNLLQSMLISAPGSQTQKFHIDTMHLNAKEGDKDEHLTAHIINVFIPLINITTDDLGPTELVPQSHKETRYMYNPKTRSKAKQMFEMPRPVSPLMNVGDALMFDFRILHRGLANTSLRNINRPLLVLAFSIPSFHDTANWPGPSIFA